MLHVLGQRNSCGMDTAPTSCLISHEVAAERSQGVNPGTHRYIADSGCEYAPHNATIRAGANVPLCNTRR